MSVWQDGGGVGMEYEWGEGELMMGWVEDEVGLDDSGAEARRGWGKGAATLTNGAVRTGSGRVASRSLWLATSSL